MLNLYSIFVYYVFFLSKKTPPLLPIFQLRWGVLPSLPPSVSAPAASHTRCCTALFAVQYRVLSVLFISTLHQKKNARCGQLICIGWGKIQKKSYFLYFLGPFGPKQGGERGFRVGFSLVSPPLWPRLTCSITINIKHEKQFSGKVYFWQFFSSFFQYLKSTMS